MKLHYAGGKSSHPADCQSKAARGVAVEALRWTGGFQPQSLPERQLEKKLMAGLVAGFSPHFLALEEHVFVCVLSKETGVHQQCTSS